MSKAHWYAVRSVPGAQRMAREATLKQEHGETDEQFQDRVSRRKGESLLERDCRQAKIEVFMPSFWHTVQHQRTNKLMDRRFPLLVGYAFVRVGQSSFERVRKLDTVSGFIRNAYGPVPFDDLDIGSLALAEIERKQAFDMERYQRESLNREHRRNVLNRQLGLILPKGRRRKVPLRMLAEAEMDKMTGRTRARVEEILKTLDDLDAEARDTCNPAPANICSAA